MSKILMFAVSMSCVAAIPAASQIPSSPSDRRPEFPKSIANVSAKHFRDGPRFNQVKAALTSIAAASGATFETHLSKGAKLRMVTFNKSNSIEYKALDLPLLRALRASCDGPLSFDEGRDWVQLNWVCRVDQDSTLRKYYVFQESPEIVMIIYFDGDHIKSIDAMEPIYIPGVRRLPMDAYRTGHIRK